MKRFMSGRTAEIALNLGRGQTPARSDFPLVTYAWLDDICCLKASDPSQARSLRRTVDCVSTPRPPNPPHTRNALPRRILHAPNNLRTDGRCCLCSCRESPRCQQAPRQIRMSPGGRSRCSRYRTAQDSEAFGGYRGRLPGSRSALSS
eukprot:756519-Hanusia_phi.AAC.1